MEQAAAAPRLSIGFALVKGDKPELIVQKLTELGIDRIIPFRAERSVVRWDAAKADKAVARLRSVARAAAMQCHRPDLPVVDDVRSLADLVVIDGVALATRDGSPPALTRPTLLVGPEGGWSDDELALAVPRVRLASHVLRAETAAVTAGAVLAALRGHVVAPLQVAP
jgi:16S rRNA (uracil1498-N3)-methyltransferase